MNVLTMNTLATKRNITNYLSSFFTSSFFIQNNQQPKQKVHEFVAEILMSFVEDSKKLNRPLKKSHEMTCDHQHNHTFLRTRPDFPTRNKRIMLFYSAAEESFSLASYVAHIQKYAKLGKSVWVVALYYINKFTSHKQHPVQIDAFNVHRILLTALFLANKFLEDNYYSAKFWAQLTGLGSTKELCELEMAFLKQMDFNLSVSEDQFYFFVCFHLEKTSVEVIEYGVDFVADFVAQVNNNNNDDQDSEDGVELT